MPQRLLIHMMKCLAAVHGLCRPPGDGEPDLGRADRVLHRGGGRGLVRGEPHQPGGQGAGWQWNASLWRITCLRMAKLAA